MSLASDSHPANVQARTLQGFDLLAILGLVGFLAWDVSRHLVLGARPASQAAIVLRCVLNFSQGLGLAWNPGEPSLAAVPDLPYTLLVALAHRLGAGLEGAAGLVALISHFASVVLVYLASRRLFGVPPVLSLVPALYLAVGPGLRYSAVGHSVVFSALLLGLAWYLALQLLEQHPVDLAGTARRFGAMLVLLTLADPQGVLMGLVLLACVLFYRNRPGGRLISTEVGWVFGGIGGAALFGIWLYFGSLPGFGGGWLLPGAPLRVAHALGDVWMFGSWFLATLVLGLALGSTRQVAASTLTAVLGCTAISAITEFEALPRARYAVLPLVLMAWAVVWHELLGRLGRLAAAQLPAVAEVGRVAGVGLAIVVIVQHDQRWGNFLPSRFGLYDVGRALHDFSQKGYTLATSQVGVLPLYSRWRAVDLRGLTSPGNSLSGAVPPERLDQLRPELLMFRAPFSPGLEASAPRSEAWQQLAAQSDGYARARGYRLVAAFGRHPMFTHYYYVRPDFPDSAAIAAMIQANPYYWDGAVARNYAAPPDPSAPPDSLDVPEPGEP